MSDSGWGGVHSPLTVVIVLHRRRGCSAWCSSAPAPSPLGRCLYGDSSHCLAPSHIGRCACGDSSGPTPSPIGRCSWSDSCHPPLDVLRLASVRVAVPLEVVVIVCLCLRSAADVLLAGSWSILSPDLVGWYLGGL